MRGGVKVPLGSWVRLKHDVTNNAGETMRAGAVVQVHRRRANGTVQLFQPKVIINHVETDSFEVLP